MASSERIMWAVLIILADMIIFFVPVAAVFAAFLLLVRPVWFRDLVLKIYRED